MIDDSSAKIKKVQFLGDKAIIIIDNFLIKRLGIDNNTYLKEEISPDGNIVLSIEPLGEHSDGRISGATDQRDIEIV